MKRFMQAIVVLFSLLVIGVSVSQNLKDPEDAGSGFGGTGNSSSGFGGTGVIGTIDDFGSIWVNGIEIGYGNSTQIRSELVTQERLRLGQQVVLTTLDRADKTLTAAIEVYYPIAGQITGRNGEMLIINNQYRVRINQHTRQDDGLSLAVGRFIAVNGHPTSLNANQPEWVATRLNANPLQRRFYHAVPPFRVDESTKQLVLELTVEQLQAMPTLRERVQINAFAQHQPHHRIMVRGRLQNQQWVIDEIAPYQQAQQRLLQQNRPIPNKENVSLHEQLQLRQMQQEQMQLMQQQREQKQMLQNQIEQQKQLQELQSQMEQLQTIKNQVNKPF